MAKLIKHRSIGKIRMELVDYVLNCTDDELYNLCCVTSEIKGITSWFCEESEKRFGVDRWSNCDEARCKKIFFRDEQARIKFGKISCLVIATRKE